MVKAEIKIPYQITVPADTELNYGLHEDGDSFRTTAPTDALVIGKQRDGALPVRIIQDGKLSEEIFFFHQPERELSKP